MAYDLDAFRREPPLNAVLSDPVRETLHCKNPVDTCRELRWSSGTADEFFASVVELPPLEAIQKIPNAVHGPRLVGARAPQGTPEKRL